MTDDVIVSFTVRLDTAKIKERTLDDWAGEMDLLHDTRPDSWPELFHMIAMEYLAGGDLSAYVIDCGGSQAPSTTPRPTADDPTPGVDVKAPATTVWVEGAPGCPGTPHRGHTRQGDPCPITDAGFDRTPMAIRNGFTGREER